MAATSARETTTPPPPPVIGKAGRYTVFITPPATPRPLSQKPISKTPLTPNPNPNHNPSPVNVAPLLEKSAPPEKPAVLAPPPQFEKMGPKRAKSVLGFLWDAVSKVQNAHESLDKCMADWLGLNQSKYQWAVDDYYENSGSVTSKDCGKLKEQTSKDQTV